MLYSMLLGLEFIANKPAKFIEGWKCNKKTFDISEIC